MPTQPHVVDLPLPLASLGMDPLGGVLLYLSLGVTLLTAIYTWRAGRGIEFIVLALLLIATSLFWLVDNILVFIPWAILTAVLSWAIGQNTRGDDAGQGPILPSQVTGVISLVVMGACLVILHTASDSTFSYSALKADSVPVVGPILLLAIMARTAALADYTWRGERQPLAAASSAFLMTAGAYVVGIYPFARLVIGIFGANSDWRELALWVGFAGALLLALAAASEDDSRRVVSYTALAQLLVLFAGLSLPSARGLAGSLLLLLGYTFSCTALFIGLGVIERGVGERRLSQLGGLGTVAPGSAVLFAVAALALVGLPPLGTFLGQVGLLAALFGLTSYWPAALYILSLLCLLFCLLRLFRAVFLGRYAVSMFSPVGRKAIPVPLLSWLPLVVAVLLATLAPYWASGVIDPVVRYLLR